MPKSTIKNQCEVTFSCNIDGYLGSKNACKYGIASRPNGHWCKYVDGVNNCRCHKANKSVSKSIKEGDNGESTA